MMSYGRAPGGSLIQPLWTADWQSETQPGDRPKVSQLLMEELDLEPRSSDSQSSALPPTSHPLVLKPSWGLNRRPPAG